MDVNLDSTTDLSNFYNNNFVMNPTVIIIITTVIILYLLLFSSLGTNNTENSKGSSIIILETLLWAVFVILLLLNGIYYFFNIDLITSLKNIFTKTTEIDIAIDTNKTLDSNTLNSKRSNNLDINYNKEVYHIPDNKYTYNDAKAICKALGSRLANYKELEESYNNNADWCSYGWSEDQMALFPTQYEKWYNLQKIKGHEHDCGRPGINGGFIDNKNVRFGVNCYGTKPKINSIEREKMNNTSLYPLTLKEQKFNKNVEYWRSKLSNILISPFNNDNWNMS